MRRKKNDGAVSIVHLLEEEMPLGCLSGGGLLLSPSCETEDEQELSIFPFYFSSSSFAFAISVLPAPTLEKEKAEAPIFDGPVGFLIFGTFCVAAEERGKRVVCSISLSIRLRSVSRSGESLTC